MKRFLLVFGRYDGYSTFEVEAETAEDAKRQAAEFCVNDIDAEPLFEIAAEYDLSAEIEARRAELRRQREVKCKAEAEANERAEYERLKAKFGGGT